MLYDKLVEKILSCEKLKNALDAMVFSSDSMNLVDREWNKILKDSSLYKKHLNKNVKFSKGKLSEKKFHVKNIIGVENAFDVIVAGMWSFSSKEDASSLVKTNTTNNNSNNSNNNNNNNKNSINSIMCRACQPLIEIGKSMAEHDRLEMSENCKFFMDKCNISVCDKCAQYKAKYNADYNDWCVKSTKIFDGENVKSMIKQSVEEAFKMSSFYGILRLNIYSRFSYGEDRFKIGGKCLDMILFKESSLIPTNKLLGMCNFSSYDESQQQQQQQQQNLPKLTFGEEENKVVIIECPESIN